jgi:hypothetical protein
MSTRSNIAIEDPKTKKVKVIYVHSDGYPYGVVKMISKIGEMLSGAGFKDDDIVMQGGSAKKTN